MQPNPFAERKVKLSGQIEFLQLRKAQFKGHQADIDALRKKNNELPPMEVSKVEPSQAEDLPGASRQEEIEILEKKNSESQTRIGSLKVEPPPVDNFPSKSRPAEFEIPRKKSEEPKAEIGTLREKQQQQQPSASPANQVAGATQPPIRGGEMAVGNRDPKAAAMTLKEAIEAMNANSGAPARRAVK
jgi:hypothetical protein